MSATNSAAWLTEARGKPLKVAEAPMPKAGPNQVVIKNRAVAVNPVDWKVQQYGMIIKNYPFILGTDVAGEVHEVGEGVTHVKRGDRVIGHAFSLLTQNPQEGGYQQYTLVNSIVVAKIPDSMSYESASVLPLSISTAASTLFHEKTLGAPMPSSTPQQTNKSVLVWGGSSSVGASAIQLAAAAGLKVVATAGKHNLQKVKELGASEVFDYSSPTVSKDIVSALQGTEYLGVSDCIGDESAAAGWSPVFEKLGGKYGSVMPDAKGIPEGAKGATVFAPLMERNVSETVWGKFVPEALASGALKPKPDAEVFKGGLEKVQDAIDQLQKGVSFKKLVVEL